MERNWTSHSRYALLRSSNGSHARLYASCPAPDSIIHELQVVVNTPVVRVLTLPEPPEKAKVRTSGFPGITVAGMPERVEGSSLPLG